MTKLGAVCTSDADCGATFRCVTPKDNDPVLGGGAVNGYCTKDCLKSSDCGMGNSCITPPMADKGECFLGCAIGPELKYIDDMLDPMKCLGREDLRCSELSAGVVCVPQCGKDSQCGGRKCDPASGACSDKPHTGKPMGALCDDKAMVNECAGFCQKFSGNSPSICSQGCVLAGELINGDDCGGLAKGLCIYRPKGYGAGDFGRCAAACTVHDQCGNPAWWCNGNTYAKNGFCFTSTDCKTVADCTAAKLGPEYGCVQTKYGGKCLELDPNCVKNGGGGGAGGGGVANCPVRFPLGAAAPPVGTGGAGGA